MGVRPWHVCRFDEIVSVSDFLSGDHRGTMLKGILAAGRLVPSHASAQELGSFFVSTRTGRCRFFSHWTNFEAVRQALRKIAPAGSRPPLTEDPRLLPLFVLAMLAAVAGIVWALL